jgi:hypothetical protein
MIRALPGQISLIVVGASSALRVQVLVRPWPDSDTLA